jgi:2-C-methyl-D-erythritol 4-phosphate cytidylyltransferase
VKNALDSIRQNSPHEKDLVAVHDAARCCVHPLDVEMVVRVASRCGAASLGDPLVDTLKKVEEGTCFIAGSVPRDGLWRVQTPQVFEFQHLFRGHQEAVEGATDDTTLVEPFCRTQLVAASHYNPKVTTPSDLAFAELLLTPVLSLLAHFGILTVSLSW